MKKEEFLKLLYARLVERGIDKATAEKETSHVRTYLTESGMEELNVSLDEMADGIISMIEAGKEQKNGTKQETVPIVPKNKTKKNDSVSDELGAAIANIDDKPRRTPKTEEAKPEVKSKEQTAKSKPKEKAVANKNDNKPADGEEKRSLLYRMMEKVDKLIKNRQKAKAENAERKTKVSKKDKTPKDDKGKVLDDSDIIEYVPRSQKEKIQYDTNGRMKNEWLYITILVVAIPIVVALVLISSLLYVAFWIALALMMIACITVLVAFVAVGSIISIVGIVYGVVELIIGNTPVGLFEIGLGVIVGAAVMFVGILIYNIAVRFIPFGMKLLAKLFRLGFRALRAGYNMLKGAVSDI